MLNLVNIQLHTQLGLKNYKRSENLKLSVASLIILSFFLFKKKKVMSGKGYASIPQDGEGSSNEPLLSSRKEPSLLKRFELFVRRNFYHILTLCTVAIILIILAVYTLIPETSLLPSNKHPQIIKSGVSEFTMEQGREKCLAIKSRPKEKNLPNQKRAKNPRAESTQQPILIKNAVVWDGQGEILNDVDIYVENGVIRQVEAGIKLKDFKNVKVIDAAGHVVGPGLVDMHR